MKYSDFAAKVSGRSSISGRKIESTMDMWLEARMAPPSGGMCSRPVICGRQRTCKSGPATTLDSWYCTQQLLECRSAWLLKDIRGQPMRTRAAVILVHRCRRGSGTARSRGPAATPGGINRSDRGCGSPAQLAQMFWLAVREEKLGDGVGVVAWAVPSVWVVVP